MNSALNKSCTKLVKTGSFDAAHRLVNHKGKCVNLHGHTYHYEITLREMGGDIEEGFVVDFSTIKKLIGGWIDEKLDHTVILNPVDKGLASVCMEFHTKPVWFMCLNGVNGFCNPTAENIAREIYVATEYILQRTKMPARLENVLIRETPTSYVICDWVHKEHKATFIHNRITNLNKFIDSCHL